MANKGKRSSPPKGKPSARRGTGQLGKPGKRRFKKRDVPLADLLEWIVSRNPQQVVVLAAVALAVVGLAIALVLNSDQGPDLSEWRDGPAAYAQLMAGRTDTSPVVALYLYKTRCHDCRSFERRFLVDRQVKTALASDELVRVNVDADASGSAIAALYNPPRYPALYILRPPPRPAREVHLLDPASHWLTVPAFLKRVNEAITFPDVSRGGVMATGAGDQP